MLAPLGDAYVGDAFDAIDYPRFLGPESERPFAGAIADTFWRAVTNALGAPSADDRAASAGEGSR
jgi:hypothetical protein